MSQPLLIIDFETTGLSAAQHAPLEIAALILGGPHHGTFFHERMRPHEGAVVDQRALDCNGYRELDFQFWQEPAAVCHKFIQWTLEHFPAPQVVTPCGYNFNFDRSFLKAWIERTGAAGIEFYGNVFAPTHVEVMNLIKATWPDWRTRFPKMKQTVQYEYHFGTPLVKAHQALSDVYASRTLLLLCDQQKINPQYGAYHHQIPPRPTTCNEPT